MLKEGLTWDSAVAGMVGVGDQVTGHRRTIRASLRRETGVVPLRGCRSLLAGRWIDSSSWIGSRLGRKIVIQRVIQSMVVLQWVQQLRQQL
jgi:hypothetical protein